MDPKRRRWGADMPQISVSYGLIITMNFGDHDPPHFHVRYAEYKGKVRFDTFELMPKGNLPLRAARMAIEWARLRAHELQAAWMRANANEDPGTIDPLP